MRMRPPGPPPKMTDGLAKPKSIKEYPRYFSLVFKGFFTRLFYIVSLVWESSPIMLITMIGICLINGLLPVIGAYISKYLIDAIALLIGHSASGTLGEDIFVTMSPVLTLLIWQLLYLVASRIVTKIDTTVAGISGELVVNHIRLKIMNKAKEVDIASYDRPEFYEKLENANREAGIRPIGILLATLRVISNFISIISFIAVLMVLTPLAPLVVIVAAIPAALVNYHFRNRNFHYIRRHSKERREMNYYSSLMVDKDSAKEIRILGTSDRLIDKYNRVFKKYYKGLKGLTVREGVTSSLVSVLSAVASALIFLFVAYTVVFETGQIGDFSLYTGALSSITSCVSILVTSTATIYEGTLFIDNMIQFMNEEVTVKPIVEDPAVPERGIKHTVEFKNVSFRYPGTDRDVIKNLNLTFNAGESVVLVGLNGAGKTTLIKLLTRLYDPTKGQIFLDGRDIREYDIKEYYAIFGIVFQDFERYATSASENIEFGDVRRSPDRDRVIDSATRTGADEFITKLPLGYDTPLTRMFEEDGIELSGGQWQKLSVARAFYKDSEILILDEPTASLDALAEAEVYNQFRYLAKDRITLFVSHRLSSARSADKIVVLDGGMLTELGNHDELMALGGTYYNLFTTQAKNYQENI